MNMVAQQQHEDEANELELGQRVAWGQRSEWLVPWQTLGMRFAAAFGPWKLRGL
jgi:hypothetical protein